MTDYEKAYRDLRAAVGALRDEWWAEPAGSSLLNNQAAVRLMHVLAPAPASETARGVDRTAQNALGGIFPAPAPPTTVQADRDAGQVTLHLTPEKYPLNRALAMDKAHTHLWVMGDEPQTLRCAECNTIGRWTEEQVR